MALSQRHLHSIFSAPPARHQDVFRKDREQAKALALAHGIEIKHLKPGFNVLPPKSMSGPDAFARAHYCLDWSEVLYMVRTYAGLEVDDEDIPPLQAAA